MSDVIVKALWIYGVTIVVSLAVAVVIKLIVVVLNALERKPAALPEPVAAAAPAPGPGHGTGPGPGPGPAPAPAPDVPGDHVAAIAAAVYALVGAHRIVHIEAHRHGEWAVEGRMAHHAAHTVAHRPKRQ